jgi:uncharacterized membrane protein YgcG
MKTKIIVPVVTALVFSACSSSYVARSGNDDLYYSPAKGNSIAQQQGNADRAAAPTSSNVSEKRNSGQMSDYEKYRNSLENEEQGDTTAAQPDSGQTYADSSAVQNEADSKEPVVESDNYYGDGSDVYADNNYYYASMLNRFHGGFYDPYFYDPFYYNSLYNPWYTPGWSFSIGFGWGWPYYSDYYYPSFGYWGYYGYSPYRFGYYGHGFYDGYGYRGYGYGYGYESYGRYGRIPNRSGFSGGYIGRRAVNMSGASAVTRVRSTRMVNPSTGVSSSGRRYTSTSGGVTSSTQRSVYTRRVPVNNGSSVNSNVRRYGTGNPTFTNRERVQSQGASNTRTYTPSYYKPRTYSRPSYNVSNPGYYSRGRTSSSPSYSRPSSSSRGSYNPGVQRRYSAPAYNGGSQRTYTPSISSSRGSSSPSYSSGSRSSSSGSSSGGHSGGGGRRR